MTTSVRVFTNALREIGLDGSLDNPQARGLIDASVYDAAIAFCLEQGEWNFALKNASIASSATPAFGYTFQFAKPADWVRTVAFSSAATFVPQLADYIDQGGVWQANSTPIYVKYVSNDSALGTNLALWTESFARFVECELALRIVKKLPEGLNPETLKAMAISYNIAREAALTTAVTV